MLHDWLLQQCIIVYLLGKAEILLKYSPEFNFPLK